MFPMSLKEGKQYVDLFLREGMVTEAKAFISSVGPGASTLRYDSLVQGKIFLAEGKFGWAMDKIRYVEAVEFDARPSPIDVVPTLLSILDGKLRELTDEQLKTEPASYRKTYTWMTPIIFMRLRKEFADRGMDPDECPAMADLDVRAAEEIDGSGTVFTDRKHGIEALLAVALIAHTLGFASRPYFARATAHVMKEIKDGFDIDASVIAEVAGQAGAFDFVRELDEVDWEGLQSNRVEITDPCIWFYAALGCVKAGNVSKVIEIMDTKFGDDAESREGIADSLISWLYDAGQIEQARLLDAKYPKVSQLQSEDLLAMSVARARRGEDVLPEALSRMNVAIDGGGYTRYSNDTVARVSIATIGFARAMKRRMGV
jgi:hypothetical protein